jgi:hypothetical protein
MRGLGIGRCQFLLLNNISGSGALGTVDNLDSYPGAFAQRFEAVGLDRAVVYKNVRAAILLDKAKTL